MKKGNIVDKAIWLADKMDEQPWAMILFCITCTAIMVACALAYNSVVPAYQ